MNIKDILSDKIGLRPYIFKSEYYGSIYKKTEKITCAVFLITDNNKDNEQTKDIIKDIRKSAQDALVAVVDVMVGKTDGKVAATWARDLVLLRSLLFVLVVARGVSRDLVDVLVREIDGVIENIYELGREQRGEASNAAGEDEPGFLREERVRRERRGVVLAPFQRAQPTRPSGAGETSGGGAGRRESILSIIRSRGVVSIKDISDSVTDCSEKTIQRELINLIKDNLIVKEGERRWSKYKVV